jgi:hypothetical protein
MTHQLFSNLSQQFTDATNTDLFGVHCLELHDLYHAVRQGATRNCWYSQHSSQSHFSESREIDLLFVSLSEKAADKTE